METTNSFNTIGFRTLLGREIHRFLRLPNQTIFPPLITASLYILIFGYAIGKKIPEIDGVPYMQFIIPGLIMMSVISGSFGNTSSSLFSMRFQGFIQELLVSSMSNFEIVLAIVLGGVIRGVVIGILVAAVSTLLAGFTVIHPLTTLFFMTFGAVIFSCMGFLSATWAQDFDRLSVFQNYLLTPLTYLGGVFFSISTLPSFWQHVSKANPILYFVNGLRYGILGVTDISVTAAAVMSLLIAGAMLAVCYTVFRIGYNVKT
jgi:ABC-2 type transport system permease protein